MVPLSRRLRPAALGFVLIVLSSSACGLGQQFQSNASGSVLTGTLTYSYQASEVLRVHDSEEGLTVTMEVRMKYDDSVGYWVDDGGSWEARGLATSVVFCPDHTKERARDTTSGSGNFEKGGSGGGYITFRQPAASVWSFYAQMYAQAAVDTVCLAVHRTSERTLPVGDDIICKGSTGCAISALGPAGSRQFTMNLSRSFDDDRGIGRQSLTGSLTETRRSR